MPDLKIITFPNPILKNKTEKIKKPSSAEKDILKRMADTMYLNHGIGLAAIQVGILKQLIVLDVGDGLIKMINPFILKKDGDDIFEEGCLSCPGITVKVKRPEKVWLNYVNEEGEVVDIKAEGLLARAVQHEIDHLSGKLIIDYMSPIKKFALKFNKKK